MKRIPRLVSAVALGLLSIQCQGREAPLSVELDRSLQTAVSAQDIQGMIQSLFKGGNRTAALNQFKNVVRQYERGKVSVARGMAFNLIDFSVHKFETGKLANPNGAAPPTTEEALAELIGALLEFVGLGGDPIPAGAFEEDGAFAICGPEGCVVVTGTEFAGVAIPPGALDEDVVIAISRLPNSPGPLPTDLDQYPLFYDFVRVPDGEFDVDVDVALCVLDNPPHPLGAPPSVVPDLALAHSIGDGIEILPPAPFGFIDCTDANTLALRTGGWSDFLATLFRPLTPATLLASPGGLGGGASSFSPFGAVDTESGESIETATTLDAEPDTVTAGNPITLTATVSPAPFTSELPVVEFFEGTTSLGTAPTNVDGVATLVVPTSVECDLIACLGLGSHTIFAQFQGTDSHIPSASDPVTVLVTFPFFD